MHYCCVQTEAMPASTIAMLNAVPEAAPSKARLAKAQEKPQAPLQSSSAQILPKAALHQVESVHAPAPSCTLGRCSVPL